MKSALYASLGAAVLFGIQFSAQAQNTATKITQRVTNAQQNNQAPQQERDAAFEAVYGQRGPTRPQTTSPAPTQGRPTAQGNVNRTAPSSQALVNPNQLQGQRQPVQRDSRFEAVYGTQAPRGGSTPAPSQVRPSAGQPTPAQQPVFVAPPPRKEDPEQEQRIIKFQRRNAISGNRTSQYDLGMRYLNGKGVEKDEETARLWLKMSADQGYARAVEQLKQMDAKRSPEILKKPEDIGGDQ